MDACQPTVEQGAAKCFLGMTGKGGGLLLHWGDQPGCTEAISQGGLIASFLPALAGCCGERGIPAHGD